MAEGATNFLNDDDEGLEGAALLVPIKSTRCGGPKGVCRPGGFRVTTGAGRCGIQSGKGARFLRYAPGFGSLGATLAHTFQHELACHARVFRQRFSMRMSRALIAAYDDLSPICHILWSY